MRVLFVCYANYCRSPAAEYYAKKWAVDHGLQGKFEISSAGFNSWWGGAHPETVKALGEEGVDMSDFSSKNLSSKMVADSDYVFTMGASRRDLLRYTCAGADGKVFTLREFATGDDSAVLDPFDAPVEEYRATLVEIKRLVELVMEKVARERGLA